MSKQNFDDVNIDGSIFWRENKRFLTNIWPGLSPKWKDSKYWHSYQEH